LGQKQDEKRAATFDEDDETAVVIDEEELALLREMKDLKRGYREDFDRLKQAKLAIADAQTAIDQSKQQIVYDFERWYGEQFEPIEARPLRVDDHELQQEPVVDEEAEAYLKAKRQVDTLHRAKKLERMRPGKK